MQKTSKTVLQYYNNYVSQWGNSKSAGWGLVWVFIAPRQIQIAPVFGVFGGGTQTRSFSQVIYRHGLQNTETTHLLSVQGWFLFHLHGEHERNHHTHNVKTKKHFHANEKQTYETIITSITSSFRMFKMMLLWASGRKVAGNLVWNNNSSAIILPG